MAGIACDALKKVHGTDYYRGTPGELLCKFLQNIFYLYSVKRQKLQSNVLVDFQQTGAANPFPYEVKNHKVLL